jgi:antitoxin (DNA-binding transcriptional repressor) of toxin-antitoxin stability system
MNTYTYSEARQKLSMLLNRAKKEGKVIIKRKDGTTFEIKAITENKSPLNVKGINLNLKTDEIINYIKDSRSSKYYGNITSK